MVSSAQWTWVWTNTGKWWRTGKPGVLLSIGSQSRTGFSNWTATCGIYLPFSGMPCEERGGGCWLPPPCFPSAKEESFTKCHGTTQSSSSIKMITQQFSFDNHKSFRDYHKSECIFFFFECIFKKYYVFIWLHWVLDAALRTSVHHEGSFVAAHRLSGCIIQAQ